MALSNETICRHVRNCRLRKWVKNQRARWVRRHTKIDPAHAPNKLPFNGYFD